MISPAKSDFDWTLPSKDYRDPEKFFLRNVFTRALKEHAGMVLQRLSGVAHGHRHRDRHAALTGGTVACGRQLPSREVEVGVRHHDRVILRFPERLDALAGRRRTLVDMLGHRRRTDERDGGHVGVIE